ncbi:MAG: cation-translocating P-type ATPase [Proteobacteria bacterium]|nr:cation-translocating P-type ATPase [Pseudomonadota bacterium]
MNWHALKAAELLDHLEVSAEKGLSEEDAGHRLAQYGSNELEVESGQSVLQLILAQFKDSLIIILFIASLLSFIIGEPFDAGLILLIVLFSAGLGFFQGFRAEKAIESLRNMILPETTVLRDGREKTLKSAEVVPGDILILRAGDCVPADARLLEEYSLCSDEASLTGESLPVEKSDALLPDATLLADRVNMLFSGTVITYGRGKALVVSTGRLTELGKIAAEVKTIEVEKTPLELRTQEVGKWLGIISVIVCSSVAGIGIVRELFAGDLTFQFVLNIFMFSVALAVAAVPEALVAIVTGTLAIGMREMAANNAIVRKMPAVETLGCVTVICSDKTGTLTKGEMTVVRIYAEGRFFDIGGVGYEPVGKIGRQPGDEVALSPFIRAGIHCNDARLFYEGGKWNISGSPTEGAMIVLAEKAGFDVSSEREKLSRLDEIPFSSERKLMSTVHRMPEREKLLFMKGAPERVIERCIYEIKDGLPGVIDEMKRRELLDMAESMASEGLRVIALAEKRFSGTAKTAEENMTFLGFAGLLDPPRAEAASSVEKCREVGIRPVMITGDHSLTALAVAKKVGIYQSGDQLLSGSELEALSDDAFEDMVEDVSVYARVSPLDKLRIIRAWKKKGHVVAMTGDGVNDAPALKQADIGVAMGITGTEVSREAADMVLADDNFASIVKAVEQGRWIYDNIKKYLVYLLESNVVEVIVIGGVALLKGEQFLPLLPAAILYLNLITDGLPALALGIAPPEPDIMKRPPRSPGESVFSREVVTFISVIAFINVPFFFWLFFREDALLTARTDLFFIFILVELVLALNLRSLRFSSFRFPPHRLLVVSVALSLAITFYAMSFDAVRSAFGVAVPGMELAGIGFIIGLVVTIAIELVKWLLRRKDAGTLVA